MKKYLTRLLAGAALAFLSGAAIAGTGSITVLDSTGTTRTYAVVTNAGSQFVTTTVLCDQVAAANCATVTVGNALKVDGSASTQPVSGSVTATLGAGVAIAGKVGIDQTTPGTTNGVQVNAALPAGANTIGAVTVSGTPTVNQTQWNGTAVSLGNGTVASGGSLRVTMASDSTGQIALASGAVVGQAGGPWTQNVTQFGSSNVVTGTGVGGAGIPRVTVSNDSAVKLWDGTSVATMKAASTAPVAADVAQVVSVSPNNLGCAGKSIANTNYTPINTTAGVQLATGVGGQQIYICKIDIPAISASANISLVEGTGTVCATSTAGMYGGATAATGPNFLASGGWVTGDGQHVLAKTATLGDNVCLLTSSSAQISGVIVWIATAL